MAKMVKFETPGLQHSVGLNWRQAAWPRFLHAGLGGQWKSTNADILAGGFPVCIDFQLSFCSAWRCKALMDLVCKLSPWLIDATMSCSESIGLGIHVLPFIHVDLSHWPSGWIHSNKFMSNSLVADRDQQIHHTVSMTPWCFSLSRFDLVSNFGVTHISSWLRCQNKDEGYFSGFFLHLLHLCGD